MSTLSWTKMPFKYGGESDFYVQLDKWIGDVFYERLPAHGYETREEQIYTTYYIVKALREKRVLFAEAGSGTGKTFAYILTTLCYARFKGKPVILSSASTVLQDQLLNKKGDIATLSRELNLNIDARAAKRPEHYVCEVKVNRLTHAPNQKGKKELLHWAEHSTYGERSELPEVSDTLWSQVGWDSTLRCDRCKRKGYCRFAKARQHFQGASDFVVCEHEVFFRDLWAREELLFKRHVPYLPIYSAVVLDEGHLVELPMAKTLGSELNHPSLKQIVTNVTDIQDQRVIVYRRAEETRATARRFFNQLGMSIIHDEHAERMHVRRTPELIATAQELIKRIEVLQDELVIEESLNEETPFALALASYQEQLDAFRQGLIHLLLGTERSVAWWEPELNSAFVLPREYSTALHAELLSKRLPVVFTSATLAAGSDFSYITHITGALDAIKSQVNTPFALEDQVVAYVATDLPRTDDFLDQASKRVGDLLHLTNGRTLVLCSSFAEVEQLRRRLEQRTFDFRLLWEGDADRNSLAESFRDDKSSVLVGSGFWEGIDVPGEALSQVIVFTLPFPRHDPLVEARRREVREKGLDPTDTVDNPLMLIKLRQGFGRLVRTNTDRGIISILDSRPGTKTYHLVTTSIPRGIHTVHELPELASRAGKLLRQRS